MKYLYACIAALLLAAAPAGAQFYSVGNESPMKWSTVRTDHYRLVYPEGLDSLARAYAVSLEQYQRVVGNSCYTAPNQLYSKPMPVVLHPFNAYSNGSVAWAPRTMDLYTIPSAYGAEAWPWMDQLTLHENRHVAQMQFGRFPGTFNTFSTLFGQLCTGGLAGIYPGPALLEGDAVAAETALSGYGRGRSSDFLRYYKAAFDEGQSRDFWQWRYGSQKNYTPDYYRAGYVLVAGMRATYNEPEFTGLYYYRLDQRAWRFWNLQKTVKQVSGKKFKAAFGEVEEHFRSEWRTADSLRAERAPFVEGTPVTSPDRLYDSYSNLVFLGDELVALRSGMQRNTELVRISPSGKSRHERVFTRAGTKLAVDEATGTLWWTEYTPSPLWEMESSSRLYAMGPDGKIAAVVKNRKLYNAAAGLDGEIAVAEYLENGLTRLDVFESGKLVDSIAAPAGIQVVEPVWTPFGWYASAVTEEGYGIYRASDWRPVAGPAFASVATPFWHEGAIWFCGEFSGEMELYSLDVQSGRLLQRSSTKRGVKNCVFSPDGSEIYYTSQSARSNGIYKLPASSLTALDAGFVSSANATAAALSKGEAAQPEKIDVSVSEPARYRKGLHAFRFHSWAPIYIDYNPLEDLSYETTTTPGSLGATVWTQNDLGTLTGMFGFSLESDYVNEEQYRTATELEDSTGIHPAFHAQLLYTGLPVKMGLRLDIGERESYLNRYLVTNRNDSTIIDYSRKSSGKPLVKISGDFYLPLDLSRRGWNRGLIPAYQVTYSNDRMPDVEDHWGTYYTMSHKGSFHGIASLRAYSVQGVPSSCIFPRWGIGFNVGNIHSNNRELHLYQNKTLTCDNINYALAYCYLPGLMRTHGILLTAHAQKSYRSHFYNREVSYLTAEYALPFAPVDWSFLSPVTYIRNFELHAHSYVGTDSVKNLFGGMDRTDLLAQAGASFIIRLGNLAWMPYDLRIGFKYMKGLTPESKSYGTFVLTTDL